MSLESILTASLTNCRHYDSVQIAELFKVQCGQEPTLVLVEAEIPTLYYAHYHRAEGLQARKHAN